MGKTREHVARWSIQSHCFLPVCGMPGKNTAVSTLRSCRLFCLPGGFFFPSSSRLLFKDQSVLSAAGVCFPAPLRLVWLGEMGAGSKCTHVFGRRILVDQFAGLAGFVLLFMSAFVCFFRANWVAFSCFCKCVNSVLSLSMRTKVLQTFPPDFCFKSPDTVPV